MRSTSYFRADILPQNQSLFIRNTNQFILTEVLFQYICRFCRNDFRTFDRSNFFQTHIQEILYIFQVETLQPQLVLIIIPNLISIERQTDQFLFFLIKFNPEASGKLIIFRMISFVPKNTFHHSS